MPKLLIVLVMLCVPLAAQSPQPTPRKLIIPQPASFVEGEVVVPDSGLVVRPFLVGTFSQNARDDRMQLWIFNCTHPLNEGVVCSDETFAKKLGKQIPENLKYDPKPVMLNKGVLVFYAPAGDRIFYRVGAR